MVNNKNNKSNNNNTNNYSYYYYHSPLNSIGLNFLQFSEDENGPWQKFPALKKGYQQVDIESMKVGGSGSKKSMGGVSVATEKVHAN